MAKDTRARMVDATRALVAQHGSHGTSFADILERSGAPRGSFYHHFPGGKEELVLAAVDTADADALARIEALRGSTAVDITDGWIEIWRRLLTVADFRVGCAVVGVTADNESAQLTERAGRVFGGWRAVLADLLREAGLTSTAADALAAMLVSGCEGAVIVARAERDLTAFDLVAAQLHDLAARLTPA